MMHGAYNVKLTDSILKTCICFFIYLYVSLNSQEIHWLLPDYELVFEKAIEYLMWSRKLIYKYFLHGIRNSVTV